MDEDQVIWRGVSLSFQIKIIQSILAQEHSGRDFDPFDVTFLCLRIKTKVLGEERQW